MRSREANCDMLYGDYTKTEMWSFWRNYHHWLHWKLSKRQLPVQPMMVISSKWQDFRVAAVFFKFYSLTHQDLVTRWWTESPLVQVAYSAPTRQLPESRLTRCQLGSFEQTLLKFEFGVWQRPWNCLFGVTALQCLHAKAHAHSHWFVHLVCFNPLLSWDETTSSSFVTSKKVYTREHCSESNLILSFKNVQLKMSPAKCRPVLDVMIQPQEY